MGKYGHLQTRQADQLFRILRDAGFDPDRFGLAVQDKSSGGLYGVDAVTVVLKEDQNFYFRFIIGDYDDDADPYAYGRTSDGEHSGEWSPGEETPTERETGVLWEDLVYEFREWAVRLKSELNAEDLWSGLVGRRPLPVLPPDDNTKFTADEKKILFQNIDSLLARVNELHLLNREQAADFGSRLDYLKKAGDRVGRKDWLVLVYGVVLSHFVEHGIPGETARIIFDVVSNTIGNIVALFSPHLPLLRP